ncbi:hypothetical protein B0T18DRAFT_390391 [Schizothecium vesticola]|uniref:Uncharacterized protein n=1 Tax=Schizothecium vesticola TaxID=314040 RepID=A0AA40EUJ2_9PEZI|nr:hypothetical protein B0T18DRAFT_390391 [Schizothecium vesticola]
MGNLAYVIAGATLPFVVRTTSDGRYTVKSLVTAYQPGSSVFALIKSPDYGALGTFYTSSSTCVTTVSPRSFSISSFGSFHQIKTSSPDPRQHLRRRWQIQPKVDTHRQPGSANRLAQPLLGH